MSLAAADFQYVRDLASRHSALELGADKSYLVEARLTPLLRSAGESSLAGLISRMRRGEAALQREAVQALATGETSFFRDIAVWDALRSRVLPERVSNASGTPVSMWSAAASTGQEVYSAAMLFRESYPSAARPMIMASDFSQTALDRAREGRFSQLEVNRGLGAAQLVSNFDRAGTDWQVKADVRAHISFRRVNLAEPLPSLPAMDVIFLRNVLIYFRPAMKALALQRVSALLKPGGFLALGTAETTLGLDLSLTRVEIGRSIWYQAAS